MYLHLWIFFVYAFLGWCTEVSYAALVSGRFVNRGFLNGPWCPVYGFGVVIVLAGLEPLRSNLLLLFLGSVALTAALEWLTGFVLEKLFHQRWWDYSDQPFNLGGYICLRFSIAWGLACLFVVEILHPTVVFLIRLIPHEVGLVILVMLCVGMCVDLTATVSTITKMNRQLSQVDELAARIRTMSNQLGEQLADRVLDAAQRGSDFGENLAKGREELQNGLEDLRDTLDGMKERLDQYRDQGREQMERELDELRDRLDEAMNRRILGQRRLMRAFPRMRSVNHRQAMERLRRWLDRE